VGGETFTSTDIVSAVYFAPVSSGGVGTWTSTTKYPTKIAGHSCVIIAGEMYCVAGNNSNHAPVSNSGVGNWTIVKAYPIGVLDLSCATSSYYVYCVGGRNSDSQTNEVYFAATLDHELGTWTPAASYPTPVSRQSCVIQTSSPSTYIYCVAGVTNNQETGRVEFAPLRNSWKSTVSYPVNAWDVSCSYAVNDIYCVGGNTENGPTSATYFAAPDSNGGVDAWTNTTLYPISISGESCAVFSGYIYCVGGITTASETPTNAVYFAPVSVSGIGTWTNTTAYPIALSGESCAVKLFTGPASYIFCVGGAGTNAVYFAPVSSSGVGAWKATTVYPTGVNAESCVISSAFQITEIDYLYCVGGGTNAVYFAPISSSGVGTWAATTPYPSGGSEISRVSCAIDENVIYCVGGETPVTIDEVFFASIHA
jgi:hypothetical protein